MKYLALVSSVLLATSSLVGCGFNAPGEPGEEDSTGEAVDDLKVTPTHDGGVELYAGTCNNDGFILEDGFISRLGHRIGLDVTGISARDRSSTASAVCHNANTWASLVTYACNVNTAAGNNVDSVVGTFNGNVASVSEWVNFVQTSYPAETVDDGFYLGYATLAGRSNTALFPDGDPCPASAAADLPLNRIECCASSPTPPALPSPKPPPPPTTPPPKVPW